MDLYVPLSSLCPYLLHQHLPEGSERAYHALYTANDIVNICDPFEKATFPRLAFIIRVYYLNWFCYHSICGCSLKYCLRVIPCSMHMLRVIFASNLTKYMA